MAVGDHGFEGWREGWRLGIRDSIAHVRAMQRKPRDLWHKAYFAALDEVLVHLEAMLSRGTAKSTTGLADLDPECPGEDCDLQDEP